ncbi:MAG TPA: HisA/HisF-related TIM barrel protein [Gemmatimonadales bacterium]|nr:HisA/HisF-related TIM barrel protein [Gemmatimonadales bacterium]
MRVIPVVDLARGLAVSGRGGRRDTYVPVRSRLAEKPGDARALVAAYHDALGCDECYVADLDALAGGAVQRGLLGELAGLGGRLLVDAAVATPARARELLADGVHQAVVGLETLPSFDALAAVIHAVGPDHVIFSLDLSGGQPLGPSGKGKAAADLARAATAAGASALLVLDLARVGGAQSVDAMLLDKLRRALPDVELLAGGGVATAPQLRQLADVGLDGVLIGTALHDGSLSPADLAAARGRPQSRDSR